MRPFSIVSIIVATACFVPKVNAHPFTSQTQAAAAEMQQQGTAEQVVPISKKQWRKRWKKDAFHNELAFMLGQNTK